MPKSTFDVENNNLSKVAFPTFRAIPIALLRAVRCLGRGWKKSWQYLLAVIVIIAIAYTALDIYATAELNHQLNLIRQKGEPTSVEEIIPPKVPDSKNAAILYKQAVASLKANGINVGLNGDIPAQLDKEKASAFLTKNAKAIDLIRQATAKPDCRFDIDWQHLLVAQYLELGEMRDLSRLLSLQARHEAETGKNVLALQDVRRLYVMVQQMSGEKFLMGALSQRAMESVANRALAKVLLNTPLTEEQALDFQASLPMVNWNAILHQALLTERTFIIKYPDWTHFVKPFSKLDTARGLYYWQKIISDAQNTPVPIPSDYEHSLKAQIAQGPWYTPFTKLVLPTYINIRAYNFDWNETQRREREIAFALAVYHSQHHRYPAALRQAEIFWKSTFPLDPYSNKSFHYKRENNTFLLYSIGVNRKDDGGARSYGEGTKNKDDIRWIY